MFALSDAVLLAVFALIAGASAPLGALALSKINGSQRAAEAAQAAEIRLSERHEDYRRADELEARMKAAADIAAHSIVLSNNHIAAVTEITTKEVLAIKEQGKIIHGLVNASYTAALEAQRVALMTALDAKRAVIDIREAAGMPTLQENEASVKVLEDQVGVLEDSIKDRLAKQKLAEEQVAQDHAAAAGSTPIAIEHATITVAKEDPSQVVSITEDR